MILRVVGLALVIAALSSILLAALSSYFGVSSREWYRGPPNLIVFDRSGYVHIVAAWCSQLPESSIYKTVARFNIKYSATQPGALVTVTTVVTVRRVSGGATSAATQAISTTVKPPAAKLFFNASLLEHVRAKVYIYSLAACSGTLLYPLGSFETVGGYGELEALLRTHIRTSYPGSKLVAFHDGVGLGEPVTVPRAAGGGGSAMVVFVASIPADSIAVVFSNGTTIAASKVLESGSKVLLLQAAKLIRLSFEEEIGFETKLALRAGQVARAASLAAAGVLAVALDSVVAPEDYTGRWRIFARLAELLGLRPRGRRGTRGHGG